MRKMIQSLLVSPEMIQILEALVDTRVDTRVEQKIEQVMGKFRQSIIGECADKISEAL